MIALVRHQLGRIVLIRPPTDTFEITLGRLERTGHGLGVALIGAVDPDRLRHAEALG